MVPKSLNLHLSVWHPGENAQILARNAQSRADACAGGALGSHASSEDTGTGNMTAGCVGSGHVGKDVRGKGSCGEDVGGGAGQTIVVVLMVGIQSARMWVQRRRPWMLIVSCASLMPRSQSCAGRCLSATMLLAGSHNTLPTSPSTPPFPSTWCNSATCHFGLPLAARMLSLMSAPTTAIPGFTTLGRSTALFSTRCLAKPTCAVSGTKIATLWSPASTFSLALRGI
ncbi:hypothetical protein BCR44DRAFT_1115917 [Catenaria anguillulae PL171]|uniref:Uncharacterized protein n=1 Tax=Catenaria anguillulae PL171 TaxID=765915 RepID=A0A1Y2HM48_9FUNG|nr:hypothetical protein BCR44DRAFT_1115917 [Catenaria anguillulae PL171]